MFDVQTNCKSDSVGNELEHECYESNLLTEDHKQTKRHHNESYPNSACEITAIKFELIT